MSTFPDLEEKIKGLSEKWRHFFLNPPYPYAPIEFQSFQIRLNHKMRSRAGLCRPREAVIELNPHLLKDEVILEEVFIHEICHLAVCRRWPRAQSHGERWKKLMTLCGMKPKRCHELIPPKRHLHRRWDITCKCQVHRVTTLILNRIQKGQRYKCRLCGELLKPLKSS